MSSWSERMTSVVTACGPRPTTQGLPYHRRVEKVKFGVPLDQVCKKDIPGPLLVMLLKLNKEGPFKKDVFRAPGHQGNMNKLIHFLQQGRLVNIHNFSVNTIASVLKQFLRKIPGGIFGRENEITLFKIFELETQEEKLALAQSVFQSLPSYSQHLLVLLFGTFRVIHGNSESAKTGMTAEALGVSVAPSFFQTCVTEGKIAKPEEVQKFKTATRITTFFIEQFGMRDLFGRENYEYYARLTGRILKVEDEWIFFTYPPSSFASSGGSAEGINKIAREDSGDECDGAVANTPRDDIHSGSIEVDVDVSSLEKSKTGSLEIIPENCPLDPNGRLSISLDDQNVSTPTPCGSPGCMHHRHLRDRDFRHATGEPKPQGSQRTKLAPVEGSPSNEETSDVLGQPILRGSDQKSYTCLPQVHQKQTERMKYRSEWFLSDPSGLVTVKCRPDRPVSLSASGPPISPSSILQVSPLQATLRGQTRMSCDTSLRNLSPPTVSPISSTTQTTLSNTKLQPYIPTTSKGLTLSSTSSPHDPPQTSQVLQQQFLIRRRLSDKDKERRLVRRSSSKRKDKENGGTAGGSSSSLDRPESSNVTVDIPTSAVIGPREAVVRGDRIVRSGSLKRTGSAETSSPPKDSCSHALLCRTGSQDTPHVSGVSPVQTKSSSCVGSSEALGSESSLTRSLPRI